MDRRTFLVQSAALGFVSAIPAATFEQARRFQPTRFSVEVRGRGRDVILIPGLMSGRHVWDSAVQSVPGYRYHLVQVSGFAGEAARGNASGRVLVPLAEELSRYIEANGLNRPAIVGHSMGGTLGLMLAARYPARVGRLMVVDMLPRPTAMYGGPAGSNLAGLLEGWIDNAYARRALSGLIAAFSPPEDGGGSDPDVGARAMHDLGRIDLTSELPRIRAPLTVVYAARDAEARAA
jgi:N-formylmaleamate deformylase